MPSLPSIYILNHQRTLIANNPIDCAAFFSEVASYKDCAGDFFIFGNLYAISINNRKFYDARKIVEMFEILRERYPTLEIPFDRILVVGKAYQDIGENERA